MKKEPAWIIGHHAVSAALANSNRMCHQLFCLPQHEARYRPLLPSKCSLSVMKPDWFEKKFGNQPTQGVALNAGELRQPPLHELAEKSALLVMLDQITDPHNLGAILRSCAVLGAGAVIVPKANSVELNATAAKAASGAVDVVPVIEVANLAQTIEKLQKEGFWAVGLAGEATQTLQQTDLKGKIILVMGSEGKGLRPLVREKCDFLAKIPLSHTDAVESLNVSVAAGIALYEAARQRG